MKQVDYEQAYVFALTKGERREYIDKKEKEEKWLEELKRKEDK